VRAARGRFDGVRNAMRVCEGSGHTRGNGCTLPRSRHVTNSGGFVPAAGRG
jgi:hypothetical protein